ncbi:alpha/beta fold hydrolase [Streptacidiphilus neutrinimicus]|uniref:alpha/beta fold hydrolase n=1 Tax=Streptacidiphilus neutrinimicus TaxID=105420 RepID=UPI0009FFE3DD|nr:alpha/beta fold hydrolase [Streptacidiphilus neutrinimicus]
MRDIEVRTPDGRMLTAAIWGRSPEDPVFLIHGTPGSRLGQLPVERQLDRLNVRVITYDRPGYGQSDRLPGRRVRDAADDVLAIADHLRLDAFGVVGRSGGGPHALACAALLPERVTRTAVMVSLAPRDAEGLDWYRGMTDSNIAAFRAAEDGPHRLRPLLAARSDGIRAHPRALLQSLRQELPPADLNAIRDPGLRSTIARNFAEAVRVGDDGWNDDVLAFVRPWGFDPAEIKGRVDLWHGEADVFSPVDHTRWLAAHIPEAHPMVEPGQSHFAAWRLLPDILSRVALNTS